MTVGGACEPQVPDQTDRTPPQTTIGKAKVEASKRKATFVFASNELGSSFECTHDRKRLKSCASPLKLKHLKPGKHKLSIAARDAAGNLDPTPATKKFKIPKKRR